MKIKIVLFVLLSGLLLPCFAQENSPTSKRAARGFLNYSNYRHALEEFLKLRAQDSTNVEYNYSIGLCYVETNIDKSKAIPYLEWVVNQPKFNPIAYYDLGRAYALNYRFDDAIEAFNKYNTLITRDEQYIPATRRIEMCQNAKVLIKNPVSVTFQNLGKDINSDAPDMNAFVTADETFMVFTTKRAGNVGGWLDFDGFYTSDIMFSTARMGIWQKPKRLPNTINSAIVEESVGMSPDGSHMFVYMENYTASGDVYLSLKTGRSFNKLEPLGKNLNTKYLETTACIAPNKKILFITAQFPDSYGGTDIYYSAKLPNGEWGPPVNLGPTINTPYDEEFPYIAPDGKTFYFSSTGHNSMGGFDIFKSVWNKEDMSFSKPVNLGYPINTPENNFTISFTKSGRYAYVSAFRPEGYGDLDIYRITFENVQPPMHFISGKIVNPDSSIIFKDYNLIVNEFANLQFIIDTMKLKNTKDDSSRVETEHPGIFKRMIELNALSNSKPQITITVNKSNNNELFGIYRPNSHNGRYVMILPPGKYSILYEGLGFKTHTMQLELPDYESFNEELKFDVVLQK